MEKVKPAKHVPIIFLRYIKFYTIINMTFDKCFYGFTKVIILTRKNYDFNLTKLKSLIFDRCYRYS